MCFPHLRSLSHLKTLPLCMGARRGEQGGAVAPPWKTKKKKKKFEKKNVQTKFFNLQKAPIVCYAKKFPHKWPPCYVLNTQKGPHMLCAEFLSKKAPLC